MTTYAIFRIIGNSLPPRHLKSDNLRSVSYILENEPAFDDCRRVWVLNKLVDRQERSEIVKLLAAHRQQVIDLPFDGRAHYNAFLDVTGLPAATRQWNEVTSASAKDPLVLEWVIRHKSQKLVGINEARNKALAAGRAIATWTLVLDGGVIIPAEGWADFVKKTTEAPHARFAVISLSREYVWENIGKTRAGGRKEEPQIAFHKDSSEVFDERLRYGNRNKAELLTRIGVDGPWMNWKPARWDVSTPLVSPNHGRFVHAGFVIRLPSGAEKANVDSQNTRYLRRYRGVAQRSLEVDLAIAHWRRRPAQEFAVQLERPTGDLGSLERFAGAMLEERDRFITEKLAPGPSGDLHDYHTVAPYWSGKGTFHDGVVQESRPDSDPASSRFDRHCMLRLTRRSYGLAFAGRLLGRRDMLAKAADLLRAWFIAPATRMNPSCRHAQLLPHKSGPSDTGIIEFREFSFLPYTLKVLADEGALGERDIEAIRAWLRQFLSDCEANGVQARALALRNNIGTWAGAVFGAISLASGNFDGAFVLARLSSIRLGMQLGPLSMQPHELERTRPLHYCLFNLSAWAATARIAGQFRLSITNFTGCQGESLGAALSFCSDNRQRFSDYADSSQGFDRWIGILESQLRPQSRRGQVHLVDTPDWGLPPFVLPVLR